jgi:dicarboxylate transporter 10
VETCSKTYSENRLRGFYRGLSASLVRQATYSTIRFAIYEELKLRYGPDGHWYTLLAIAASSGFLGSLAGNFADIINVRMQNDTALPVNQRKGYRNVFHGVSQMTHEEGIGSLMKGWGPNCTRGAAQTVGQLVSYDIIKRCLDEQTNLGEGLPTQLTASFLAGLIAVTITNPIDVIKTRVMSSPESRNVFEHITNSFREEGFKWMVKGWFPSFMRIGP